jgi:signal transduction histidine kinase
MLEINPAYAKQTGLKNAVGKTGSELVPGLQRFWLDLYGAVALTGEPRRFENYAAPLDRWFDGYVCRIGEAEERKIAVLFKDVTRNKQLQANLERLVVERTAKLGELVAELEHFSYTITHDMRAPLRAMRAFAEIVRDECANCPAQEQKKLLDRIISAAERMDTLITDSLNYSKAGQQELPLAPVDVNKLLRGILDSYPNLQEGQADVSVESNILPVLGNEAALTQCFSNLLGNSVKFAQPGTQAQIKIRSERKDGWMRLWVEDNGIGISASLLPRVFEMFTRGESPQAGTGIGLALVRKVVHRMGGKVGVESEPGKGSRFWLELRPGDLSPERMGTKPASAALGDKGS